MNIQLLQRPPGLKGPVSEAGMVMWGLLSAASIAASAYHGAKRHGGSIGWGVAWGAVGGLFPVLTPAIGAAQGFGKCKYKCSGVNGLRRRSR
jgi:hypothetical protein